MSGCIWACPPAAGRLLWVSMNVTEICAARREELLGAWVEKFISSYPLQSAGFVRTSTDPFANPVGQTIRASLGVLFDAVIGLDASPHEVKAALNDLIRLRAVQDFTPSQAVGPLFLLKDIVRTLLFGPDPAKSKDKNEQSGREDAARARPPQRFWMAALRRKPAWTAWLFLRLTCTPLTGNVFSECGWTR